MNPTLHTERLTLTVPTTHDTECLIEFYTTDRSAWVGGPLDRNGCDELLAKATKHWDANSFGLFWINVTGEDKVCGMTGVGYPEHMPEAELMWTLWDTKYEGRGIATEAAIAARDFYYATGAKTVVSYIHPDNTNSIKMAKRLGAVVDSTAATPNNNNSIVYRHPAPEAIQ
ncbi:MAG: GNAT family N-acetyltransferase [Rhodobacteraceae bacterium]|nr:GNAT family N-acetyltransferase [Paracoccaceae bacterium]